MNGDFVSSLNNTVKIGKGTTVVVAGASGGVGRAIARMLGERGANVGLLARGVDGLEGAKREIEASGGRAIVCVTDVSQFDQVEAAAAVTESAFGPIDLWINVAMVSMYSPFMQMSHEEFKHIVEVTFLGSVYGTHCALKRFQPRDKGVIIQVGSALAFRSIPLQSAYCASKHALQGFIESVRSELIHEGSHVRLSAVNLPGVNTTQFVWTKNNMPHPCHPAGEIFQPEVAAEAVIFCAENVRREIMLAWPTIESTLGEKVIPGLLDHYLAKTAWDGVMLKKPKDPNHQNNFWTPLPGDHGSHGPFDDKAHSFSPMFWLNKNRGKVLGGLLAAGVGTAAYLARRDRH